ncbi:MAG: radical SAM family heme chaperone HemW [Muribaculaceae bacterium]|nr:radical SAM family heme chaperone HemW [Muribaculaceae bacterium]
MAGIYVHIPLCKSRCTYCDFYSTVGSPLVERYVDALIAELEMRLVELGGASVHTLYIGGGTPSQLPIAHLRRLAEKLTGTARGAADLEFTVEVNPDDVTLAYIAALRTLNVNRISMGVQSFDDHELRRVNRRHTAQQALEAVNAIRQAGIGNLSLDLIFGLPGQTLASWQRSLQQALALRPEHLSAYGLSYEPGTVLWQQRESGLIRETDEETSVAMYDCLMASTRQAGYEHYEISNFALPGRRSRHNSAYWAGTPYLGLGASAHSYDGQVRRHNPADMAAYVAAIEHGQSPAEAETLEASEQYDEQVMVQLRTCEGIDLPAITERHGPQALAHLLAAAQPHLQSGRLARQGTRLALTAKGIMTSDAIICDLMA